MECTRKVTDSIYWVGGNDRRLQLFENLFPVDTGISYNSYVILDEKVALMDTVDAAIRDQFLENIEHVLNGRTIDYLVVHHMEPDHCANIDELVRRYPNMRIVGNRKVLMMIQQFYEGLDVAEKMMFVKEGDTLSLGTHELSFVMAPMVHWPEVMVSYEKKEKILFSADAFGSFGALAGHIFNDEIEYQKEWVNEARRYYTNIVGKFGRHVQMLLKKASQLDIAMICPLHGPIWRTNLAYIFDKYDKWSSYQPEEQGVLIIYASIYGNTESAANSLASRLANQGIKHIAVYDVSKTDVSTLVAASFQYSHMVLASSTYNVGIFPKMETYLNDIKSLELQNRTVAIIENGSWALTSGKLMKHKIEEMKHMTVIDNIISIKSALKKEESIKLDALVDDIIKSMDKKDK